jgi:hypothetical protein
MQANVLQTDAMKVLVEFQVFGHPKTKGSLEHIGQGKMRESVRGSKAWRKMVAERAKADHLKRCEATGMSELGRPLRWEGRVGVRVVSYLQPPPHVLRLASEAWHDWIMSDKSGDSDKLARNVLDALGCEDQDDAQIFINDGQVWDLFSHKRLAVGGTQPGQLIQVWSIPDSEAWGA